MTAKEHVIGGRYQIESLIGVGGMGSVYRALDQESGATVAVKALKPDFVIDRPDHIERFLREGNTLRQLDHPNIVKVLDGFEEAGRHYLVMEYIAGGSLRDLLQQESQLAVGRVLALGIAIADALARAHDLEIIHRDLKPGNILLAEDATPRLADFGVARIASSNLTKTGIALGTLAYMSPEALNGAAIDARVDVWSFGVLLFELLSGRKPFGSRPAAAVVTAILTRITPDLLEIRPDLPLDLVRLIERMMEKDREARIPTMRLVGTELELIAKGIDPLEG